MASKTTAPMGPIAPNAASPIFPPPAPPRSSSGADQARKLHDQAKGKEAAAAAHAKQLHDQGKADGAKHGG